jgi:hypothetical protein
MLIFICISYEEETKLKILLGTTMAVELPIAASNGREYNGKMTFIVILSCMVAATGGIIFGYDIGISGEFHIIKIIFGLNFIRLFLNENCK